MIDFIGAVRGMHDGERFVGVSNTNGYPPWNWGCELMLGRSSKLDDETNFVDFKGLPITAGLLDVIGSIGAKNVKFLLASRPLLVLCPRTKRSGSDSNILSIVVPALCVLVIPSLGGVRISSKQSECFLLEMVVPVTSETSLYLRPQCLEAFDNFSRKKSRLRSEGVSGFTPMPDSHCSIRSSDVFSGDCRQGDSPENLISLSALNYYSETKPK